MYGEKVVNIEGRVAKQIHEKEDNKDDDEEVRSKARNNDESSRYIKCDEKKWQSDTLDIYISFAYPFVTGTGRWSLICMYPKSGESSTREKGISRTSCCKDNHNLQRLISVPPPNPSVTGGVFA